MVKRNSNLVIVAIPSADDPIWKLSSEKVPHLTLLFLGERDLGPETASVIEFVEHVSKTSLKRFGLSVDRRGELGEDKADVYFFSKGHIRMLETFRSYLLENLEIFKAYNSVEQFESWTPHITLGFPESPAKPDTREYPITWVNFDRIAVWIGDYEGPEFLLEDQLAYIDEELSMSSITEQGASLAKDFLSHYGVKGMRWGVRRVDRNVPVAVSVTQKKPGTRVSATGGKNQPASEDARVAATSRQKARASTTDALSTRELQALVNRMQLEANYSRLSSTQKSAGRKFVERLFSDKRFRDQTTSTVEKTIDFVTLPTQVGAAISRTDLRNIY